MKAAEKERIYELLKNASSWVCGCTAPEFRGEIPPFEDDFEEIIESPAKKIHSQPVENKAPVREASNIPQSAPSQKQDQEEQKLPALNSKIRSCTNCILSRTSAIPFPGNGVNNPAVLVIGEAPMEDREKNLLSFAEETDVLLSKMLSAINLSVRANCFVTTSVKCLPPQNRSPMKDEQDACYGFLQAQICYLKPSVILVMGRTSAQHMLKTDQIINSLRGKFHDFNGTPLAVTFSPQQVLQDAGLKRPVWEDLKMVRAKLQEIKPDYDVSFRNMISRQK
ncbi:uracil-DNA glycosylase [Treponema sp.]|uniref:uracil-DNA glycosylase n=1 Tax=Treponema sp. TaxID=166 RepID=UPI0025796267|nr:uracil-DNA glycosylase [Treponema sp.]MBE6354412.1 uracil-DNA glycosylase [Treponema sp.]